MADPVPIVKTFMSEKQLTDTLRLDGVVALADAKHLEGRLDDDTEEGKVNIAFQQIAFSDKIILNKLDLISAEQAITVKDRIRDINKFAKILPAVKSRIKLVELTNMRSHDLTNFADIDLGKEAEVAAELQAGHGGHGGHEGHGEGHGGGHGHDEAACTEEHGGGHGGHGGHEGYESGHGAGHGGGHGHSTAKRHDNRVNSFSIIKEGEIIPRKLTKWMKSLGELPKEKGTIFRIKAILAVKGHPYKHVFHAVMDVSDEEDAAPWGEEEKKICKIVFIGKALDNTLIGDPMHAFCQGHLSQNATQQPRTRLQKIFCSRSSV